MNSLNLLEVTIEEAEEMVASWEIYDAKTAFAVHVIFMLKTCISKQSEPIFDTGQSISLVLN